MLKNRHIWIIVSLILLTIIPIIIYGQGYGDEASILEATKPPITPEQPLTPETSGIISSPITPANTQILPSSGFPLNDLIGSYKLLIMGGELVGGVIVSSKNGLAVPAFNPLTGDTVVYNMDKGDTVTIDYTSEPAYRAKMSKGVTAETKKIRFTSYGSDSMLKIKKADEPSYEFNNGLFEYENDKVLEQVSTTKNDDVTLDPAYETGFRCLSLAPNAFYNYVEKMKQSDSFEIANNNSADYKVCVRKTRYDEYDMKGKLYGMVDLFNNAVKLNAKVTYSENNQTVYESLSTNNAADIASTYEGKKLSLSAAKPEVKGVVSRVYSGYHIITEENNNGQLIRHHEYSSTMHPDSIGIYSSASGPDINIQRLALTQEGMGKFTALAPDSDKLKECSQKLKEALSYETNAEIC